MDEEYDDSSSSAVEYAKLALVIGLIFGVSLFLNSLFGSSDSLTELMRWFMGMFFIVFGTFKFIGYEMFVEMFPEYDLIAAKSKVYAYLYPFIELLLGTMYIINATPMLRDVVTIVIMLVGAVGVYKAMRAHGNIKCACLGDVIRLPLSTVSLVENLLMAAMAIVMLVS